ncbi:apses-domain-containing protein [Myriangium duriaei CBS 260.36]|uniref:Apses-domain-containing protein n=1 Tax=Myriangium duriaei CBS 260.36 TaxID=1168546 RepID=A0A9P4J6Q1_9PEZI|nr:apses-domain-containing protein [Myriangium duriaei CBS 260.36]
MNTQHAMHHPQTLPQHHYSSSTANNPDASQPQTHGHAPHSSVSSAASAHSYYQQYPHHQSIPSGIPTYNPPAMPLSGYGSYSSGIGGVNPAMNMHSQLMHQNTAGIPSINMNGPPLNPGQGAQSEQMDTTGQVQPAGCKPRVTATLWEDEATLCFQVETNGICVARREDNHMINGTKLLNVAGMTRGRRDGILKSEKNRNVVKIGPMHLKGVWIPYERALEFANKEKITERLYPLFVHNIGSLLYHNPNTPAGRPSVAGSTGAAPDRRRPEGDADYMRTPSTTQAPPLTHHHSMSGSVSAQGGQTPHSQIPGARPPFERAHTFPTPPTTAGGQNVANASTAWTDYNAASTSAPMSQSMHVDTSVNNSRSYEASRPYSHSAHPSYSSSYGGMGRYSAVQSSPSNRNEMGPPSRMGHESEVHGHEQAPSSEIGESEHDGSDYTHSAGPYGQHRSTYSYGSQPQTAITAEHHVSPDMSTSPHRNSGRATPRTASGYGDYSAAQRPQPLPSTNLYGLSGAQRAMPNGTDIYGNNYNAQTYSAPTTKRGMELEDDDQTNGLKRQRTIPIHDDASRSMISQQKR